MIGARLVVPWPLALGLAATLAACGPISSSQIDGGDGDGDPGGCLTGSTRCDGADYQSCSAGTWTTTETCGLACADALGCVVCVPGTATCVGDIAETCKTDGSGYEDVLCDPVQGLTCSSNGCQGECAPATLGTSYIGCEYYPTVSANIVANNFEFAVVLSNTGALPADVTLDGGALTAPRIFQVPANQVRVERLPWLATLKAHSSSKPSVRVAGGAYRVRSNRPLTAYQFSPIDYASGSANSYTNDASLLIPRNALGTEYRVASWPTWSGYPGLMAITASEDGTTVTVTPTASVNSGDVPAFVSGMPQSVVLDRGGVLQLLSYNGDFTGSLVTSDKPVQVIGGHACTNLPADKVACDHLEEIMFPVPTLGTDMIATAPFVQGLPAANVRMIRVIAASPNTTLTFDPPQAGVATNIANAGGFVEILNTNADVRITADHRIMVAEYMTGRANNAADEGDPALMSAVAVEQYRTSYLFHAPLSYRDNYVNVTAPTGATITLDGAAVTGFVAIGSSGYGVARVHLGPGTNGDHLIEGTPAFGISVYGYGFATSYWYPGGLDLNVIPVD